MLNTALFVAGDWHYYQKRMMAIFCLNLFAMAFMQLSLMYTLASPNLICNGEVQIYSFILQCTHDCKIADVDQNIDIDNIVTKFQLYCENKIYVVYIYSSFFLGQTIGSVTIGYMGVYNYVYKDQIGRKKTELIAFVLSMLGLVSILLSQNILQLLISHFIAGFAIFGIYLQVVVLINESCSYIKKQQSQIFMLVIWGFGGLGDAAAFYFINQWQLAYLFCCLIPLFIGLILTSIYVFESPVYLQTRGLNKEALKVYNKISVINQRSAVGPQDLDNMVGSVIRELGIKDLFKKQEYRTQVIGLSISEFFLALYFFASYYGLSSLQIFRSQKLYLTGAATSIFEILSKSIICCFIVNIQRSITIKITVITSFLVCISFYYLEDDFRVTFTRVVIIRCFMAIGYSVMTIYPNESFPSIIRSAGNGVVSSHGITGTLISPFVLYYSESIDVNPFFFIGCMGLISPAILFLLRETLYVEQQKL